MAAVGSPFYNSLNNWYLTTTTAPTRPTSWAIGLSLGSPTPTAASELATGSGMNRTPVGFSPGNAAGSCSNTAAFSMGPNSGAAQFSGLQLWDTSAVTGGNMLLFGLLATARSLGAGDYLLFAAGSIVATMG
jgi:hypothetical protein